MAKPPKQEIKKSAAYKAFSLERGEGGWVFVELDYDELGILHAVRKSEPDLYVNVKETFKLKAQNYFNEIRK